MSAIAVMVVGLCFSMCSFVSLVGLFNFGNYPILAIPAISFFHPTRPFPNLCCKQREFSNSTLGRPLRSAWVALAWPKGGPWVAQTQSQTQSQKYRQRVVGCFSLSNYQITHLPNFIPPR
jgi:hypothetical protein